MAEKPSGPRSSEGVVSIRHPRTDLPQMGWLAKPVLTGGAALYEASTGYGWYSESQSFRSAEKSIGYGSVQSKCRPHYQTEPQQGWIGKPNLSLYETTLGWGAISPGLDWPRMARKPQIRPLGEWDQDTSWDFPNLPIVFNPSTQNWTVDAPRMGTRKWWSSDPHPQFDWLYQNVLVDPILYAWAIDSQWKPKRAWWSDKPTPDAWCIPSVIFDPSLYPGTKTESYRLWKQAVGRWQADVDNAWVQTSIPIVLAFDPTTQFAATGIPGERTNAQAALNVQRNWALYDLSWIHDVIPLTDPVVVAPANIIIIGGDDAPAKKRKRKHEQTTQELFDALEQTLRRTMAGVSDVEPIEARVAVDLSQGVDVALDALLARATTTRDLSRRVAVLRQEFAAYAQRQRQKEVDADDEDWMLM